jgi:hypothetical protein
LEWRHIGLRSLDNKVVEVVLLDLGNMTQIASDDETVRVETNRLIAHLIDKKIITLL